MQAASPFVFLQVLMDTHGFMPRTNKEAALDLAKLLRHHGIPDEDIPHTNKIASCFADKRLDQTKVRSDHCVYNLIAKLIWAHGIDLLDIDRALDTLRAFWITRSDGSRWREGIPVARDEEIQSFIRRGSFFDPPPAAPKGKPHI